MSLGKNGIEHLSLFPMMFPLISLDLEQLVWECEAEDLPSVLKRPIPNTNLLALQTIA